MNCSLLSTGPKLGNRGAGSRSLNWRGLVGPGSKAGWDALHKLLNVVRSGEWTTYGDLAKLVESSPIAVGRHISTCWDCSGGYRVLNSDGSVSDNFNWSDPTDKRDPKQVLIDEGVLFPGGKADTDQRLAVDALLTRSKQSA